MNALDILIFAIAAVGGVLGFARGALAQVGQIAALVVGILAARTLGGAACGLVHAESATAIACCYAAVFLAAYGITWLVAHMLRSAVRAVHLGIVDRLCGMAFKVLQWLFLLSLGLNVALMIYGDDAELRHPGKPWRAAVVELAPKVLGYFVDLRNFQLQQDVINETDTDTHETGK